MISPPFLPSFGMEAELTRAWSHLRTSPCPPPPRPPVGWVRSIPLRLDLCEKLGEVALDCSLHLHEQVLEPLVQRVPVRRAALLRLHEYLRRRKGVWECGRVGARACGRVGVGEKWAAGVILVTAAAGEGDGMVPNFH